MILMLDQKLEDALRERVLVRRHLVHRVGQYSRLENH
jgi:hypothetical protein